MATQGDVLDVKLFVDGTMLAIHRADRDVEIVDAKTGHSWTITCRSKSKNIILRKGLIWVEDTTVGGRQLETGQHPQVHDRTVLVRAAAAGHLLLHPRPG